MMQRLVSALLLLALLLQATAARADSIQIAPVRVDLKQLDLDLKHAKLRRTIGIALAAPGIATALLGIVLVIKGTIDFQNLADKSNQFSDISTEWAIGGVVGVVGLALAIPGTILWINGQNTVDTLTWRREQQITPFVSALPHGQGGIAGLRLTF